MHTVCTWPGHLPGTHLQLPWLGNHSFPPAPGDWSCEMKGTGGQCRHLGTIHPSSSFRMKSSIGYQCHTRPCEREILFTPYPVISACLRSKAPISCSALLSWCRGIREGWLCCSPPTPRPRCFLAVIDALHQAPATRNQMGFVHELPVITQTL